MTTEHPPNPAVLATQLASLAALLAVVVGAMVLVGWTFDIAVLKSVFPGWVTMKANAAVCFILIGIALLLVTRPPAIFNPQFSILFFRLARLCGLLAGLIGVLTLCEYIFGWDPGIDQWLVREPGGALGTSHPGRMAPETALCFVLLSVALLVTSGSHKTRWAMFASVVPGLLVTPLALAAILSYTMPGLGPYGWFGFTLMAMHTAVLFAMLGMAVIVISWQQDVLQWSLGRNTTVAFACGMALLVFIGLSINRSQFWLGETNRKIAHNEEMLSDIVNIQIELTEAQAHTRGYIITGDERFLNAYLGDIADYNSKMDVLRQHIAGSPHQQQQISLIETKVNLLQRWSQQFIDAMRTDMANTSRSKIDHGDDLLDNIRITFDQMGNEHQQLIKELQRESESVSRLSYITIATGTLASLLIFLGVTFRLNSAVNESKLAENSLRESSEEIEDLYNHAPCGYHSLDKDGIICRINDTELAWLGYTRDELIGRMKWTDLITSASQRTFRENFPQLKKQGSVSDLEIEIIRKDGTMFTGLINATAIYDASGDYLSSRSSVFDITERKNAENKLTEGTRHFRAITESANDAIITGAGAGAGAGNIVGWNPAAERLFGYTETEIIGQPLTVLMPERFRNPHREGLARVLAGGVPHLIGKTVEVSGLRKDGSEFPLEISLAQWQAAKGQFFTAIIRDITERKLAEEALRISTLKHQLLFESSRDALMVIVPPSWKFTEANEATLKLFGVSSVAEFTALGPWDVSPERQPDGRPSGEKAQEMIATAMREGSHSFEWEHQRLDGQPFAADVLLTRMELGKEVFVQATVRDITERKRIEERLRASEQKFMQFFMQLPIPLVIVNKDGVMARFNDRFTEVLGYTTDDVPTIDEWWQRAYPNESYRQWVLDTWNAAVAKAAKEGVEIEPLEYKVTGKSGAERIMIVGGVTIEDNLLATLIDITERKQAEERVRESETRYRSIFEYSNDIIYLLNMDGTINSLSPAFEQITGWTAEEWIGKSFAPIVHPDDLSVANTAFQKTLSGETFPIFRLRIARKSGQYFYADFSITPFDHDVIMGIARDVSERQRAEEKIRKLNEELETKVQERTQQLLESQEELVRKEKLAVLGQVAGSVGHELRNPLGVMSNAVYFLQTVLTDADDSVKEYLNIIKSEIAGSERIVSDLLDSVRIKPPQPEMVGVGELINQTLRKLTIPPSVTVKQDIPETLPSLRVDAQQIHQVFRNLISNGVEAMPEGGTLEISAVENKPDGTVAVSVRDTGIGMTPEQLGKLFQPLFTTKARGIGLGLVVVNNLTQANGGTVNVESEAGKGTAFTVTLPAADERGVSI